jgi:pimeloyl-ACP methyl ester carboxylesterase
VAEQPQTRYAKSGDLNIGYQVVGDGPIDLVFVPGLMSHIDLIWKFPAVQRFLGGLAAFARVILYDKRGQGVSDPPDRVPTLDDDMEDLGAVLDAVGSERAALFGYSEGGPMSALFAATHPRRVSSLVLFGSFSRGALMDDWDGSGVLERSDAIMDRWGDGSSLELFAPSIATESRVREFAAFERAVGSPRMVRARFETAGGLDVTPALESVGVPTLVIHRADEKAVPAAVGRQIAEAIPGARYIEVPGVDHIPWVGDGDRLVAEVEEFLTGARHAADVDRVLATVLFTDIVDSTTRAAELGDRRWRALMNSHDQLVRERIAGYRGREVKTMGDGFLVTFDGPARAIHCARSIVSEAPSLGIEVRTGLHTGECELIGDDVGGVAVNIGARIGSLADGGEVLVSGTVKDLVVGSGLEFEDRGAHTLKGVPGEWRLFAAAGEPA